MYLQFCFLQMTTRATFDSWNSKNLSYFLHVYASNNSHKMIFDNKNGYHSTFNSWSSKNLCLFLHVYVSDNLHEIILQIKMLDFDIFYYWTSMDLWLLMQVFQGTRGTIGFFVKKITDFSIFLLTFHEMYCQLQVALCWDRIACWEDLCRRPFVTGI